MSGHQSAGVVLTAAERVTRGLYSHINRGGCPDEVKGWDSRDSECTACAMLDEVLRRFSAKTGAAQCPECEGETFSCTACGSVQEHLTTALAAQAGRVAEVVEKVHLAHELVDGGVIPLYQCAAEGCEWTCDRIEFSPTEAVQLHAAHLGAAVAAELEADHG